MFLFGTSSVHIPFFLKSPSLESCAGYSLPCILIYFDCALMIKIDRVLFLNRLWLCVLFLMLMMTSFLGPSFVVLLSPLSVSVFASSFFDGIQLM